MPARIITWEVQFLARIKPGEILIFVILAKLVQAKLLSCARLEINGLKPSVRKIPRMMEGFD